MISQVTIDKIIDTARIEDVVQDFVPLKRRGVNLIGLCPFHKEKTPSFNVSPSKGIFKCFGCGKGGNAVNFIMEHEQLDWISAIKYLAKKYRIEIEDRELTEEEKKLGSERESMLIVSAFAQKFFSRILNESEEGIAIGLSYFRERGFNDTIIEKFQLGYCPEGKSIF
ncbi:MAG: DNA primase, partial [Bacteroidales bacterium]|nr:DNA primase [Bacteroidales bacterium]